MIQELVYTSAPQGLRPGAKGYCTVAATPGMAKTLVDQLESLSGYRHHFQPQDRLAHLNPVNFSHLRITVGGIRYQVLTRAADAGVDYTQRSNKIAHHLVLDAQEVAAAKCGPAAILAAPGVMRTSWNEAPRQLEMPARSWPADRPPAVCQTWIDVTRDAGWAGALCETFLARPVQTACVLFEPGMPLLALVAEAMSLLTSQERWELGFSTYYTRLPPGIDCHWRFVINGTPEAKTIPRLPNTKLFNLCAPMGQAKGGELVETARSGIVTRTGPSRAVSAGNMATLAPQQRQDMIAPVDQPAMQEEIELSPLLPAHRVGSSSRLPAMAGSSQRLHSVGKKRGSKWTNRALIVLGALALIALGSGVTLWFTTRNQQQLVQALKEENAAATSERKSSQQTQKKGQSSNKHDNGQAAKRNGENHPPAQVGSPVEDPASQPPVPAPTSADSSPPVPTPMPANPVAVASTVGLNVSPSSPPPAKRKAETVARSV